MMKIEKIMFPTSSNKSYVAGLEQKVTWNIIPKWGFITIYALTAVVRDSCWALT